MHAIFAITTCGAETASISSPKSLKITGFIQ
jgi:hypothetical protein